MLLYVDESAFSHAPGYRRTYAPVGQTPILRHGNTHGGVQAISAVSPRGDLFFKVKSGSFKAQDIVAFLSDILLGNPEYKKFYIIWDGPMVHKSQILKDFVESLKKKPLKLISLPPYSPQLNVDEQVHGYIKRHRLANILFKTTDSLYKAVESSYQWLSDKKELLCKFFQHKDVGFT